MTRLGYRIGNQCENLVQPRPERVIIAYSVPSSEKHAEEDQLPWLWCAETRTFPTSDMIASPRLLPNWSFGGGKVMEIHIRLEPQQAF